MVRATGVSVASGPIPGHLSQMQSSSVEGPTRGMHTRSWPLMAGQPVGDHCYSTSWLLIHQWMDRLYRTPGKQLGNVAARVGRELGVQEDSSVY